MMSHSTAPGVTIRDIVRDEFGEYYPLSHQALYMSYWHLKLNTSQNELIFPPNPFPLPICPTLSNDITFTTRVKAHRFSF